MPEPAAHRPFTILDAVILTAGFAIGFALLPGFRFELPFNVIYWYARVGIGILTVGCGLILVGPLVIWRGRRLTGHWPRSSGEWLWLLSWPIALPFVVTGPGPARVALMAWLFASVMGAVALAALVNVLRGGKRLGAVPIRRDAKARRATTRRMAAAFVLWVGAMVGFVLEELPLAWGLCYLTFATVTTQLVVESCCANLITPPRRPWSHWAGLAAVAALPLGLLVFAIGY